MSLTMKVNKWVTGTQGLLTEKEQFEFSPGISLISPKLFFDFGIDSFLFSSLIWLTTLHGRGGLDGATIDIHAIAQKTHLQLDTSSGSGHHRSKLGVVIKFDHWHVLIVVSQLDFNLVTVNRLGKPLTGTFKAIIGWCREPLSTSLRIVVRGRGLCKTLRR